MNAEHIVKLHAPDPGLSASRPPPEVTTVKTPDAGKRLIRLADLFARTAVSKSTGHRLLAAGKIGARPIRLTSACVRFDAWLSTRRPDGNLHDAKTWPAVWEMLKRQM